MPARFVVWSFASTFRAASLDVQTAWFSVPELGPCCVCKALRKTTKGRWAPPNEGSCTQASDAPNPPGIKAAFVRADSSLVTAWGTTAPPPGWYPDPGLPANVRWWDGTSWTEHRAPVWQPPMGSSAGPGHGAVNHDLDYLLPVNRDGFAIASGYLALFSLIPNPVTSTVAIAFGWIALRRIPISGKLGRGRAWFGIIVGGLSLALFLVAVLAAN